MMRFCVHFQRVFETEPAQEGLLVAGQVRVARLCMALILICFLHFDFCFVAIRVGFE